MSDSADLPFRTTVVPAEFEPTRDFTPDSSIDDEWSEQDLEVLYRQTLEAVDAATEDASRTIGDAEDGDADDQVSAVEVSQTSESDAADAEERDDSTTLPRVTANQVVEAVLFVGGGPVTGKQIAELLGGESTHERVDELVESLNGLYVDQSRPYEIRLVEGGYQLALLPEFDRVRHRVFGMGPKEVKLSQDALELLALVAYRQPISRAAIDDSGKANASTVLRQLLRRELISLERDDDGKSVMYRTTPRFLELFGLKSLDDLPQVEDVMLR
jgi:segregation and condensation protein B